LGVGLSRARQRARFGGSLEEDVPEPSFFDAIAALVTRW
jgi:hypothetical protein